MNSLPEHYGSTPPAPGNNGNKAGQAEPGDTSGNSSPDDLMKVQERLKIVMESVRDQAIFTTDPENIITSWNTGAYNLFGYSAREAIGQSGGIIFTHEDQLAGEPGKEVMRALTDGHAADERYHMRKDGSIFYVSGALW